MLVEQLYDRVRAVEYARRWANGRNPLFYNFTGIGGDCTNFVSQCILAGCCVMNDTPDFGWYYRSASDRAPAWTGVEYFWNFMTGDPVYLSANGGIGPFGSQTTRRGVTLGDVIQLHDEEDDFYHTLIITGFAGQEILVSAHSDDALDRPLSDYDANGVRFLHIDGVRFEFGTRACFEGLIEGTALPPG